MTRSIRSKRANCFCCDVPRGFFHRRECPSLGRKKIQLPRSHVTLRRNTHLLYGNEKQHVGMQVPPVSFRKQTLATGQLMRSSDRTPTDSLWNCHVLTTKRQLTADSLQVDVQTLAHTTAKSERPTHDHSRDFVRHWVKRFPSHHVT